MQSQLRIHPELTEVQNSDNDLEAHEDNATNFPSSSSDDINCADENVHVTKEKKWIVFKSECDKRFVFCSQCGSIITTETKHSKGSARIIKTTCLQMHSNT